MCGICGVYNVPNGEPVSPTLVEQMTSLIGGPMIAGSTWTETWVWERYA